MMVQRFFISYCMLIFSLIAGCAHSSLNEFTADVAFNKKVSAEQILVVIDIPEGYGKFSEF